ncbi:anaphase-promoting complex subunit 11-like [Maniola hyperantus]|uniref:anaphase-promoting complex subunit 11-like n=1 Tax=Aphantopus hyperantus TaxID=2795564 RepID=UPI003749ADA8
MSGILAIRTRTATCFATPGQASSADQSEASTAGCNQTFNTLDFGQPWMDTNNHCINAKYAFCNLQDACLRCQGESKKDSYGKQDCVVVWGECNHSFHFCCMSLWVKQNNRCPLCQQEWSIQRMGK